MTIVVVVVLVLLLLLVVAVVVMTSCNSNEILLYLVCVYCGWLVCVLPQTFATLYPMKLYRVSRRRVVVMVVSCAGGGGRGGIGHDDTHTRSFAPLTYTLSCPLPMTNM